MTPQLEKDYRKWHADFARQTAEHNLRVVAAFGRVQFLKYLIDTGRVSEEVA